MRRTVRLPATDVRARDILAMLATVIAGSGLIYTAYMRGAPPSGNIAVGAFIIAALMLFVGYGGGMLMDRLAARHPILIRRYNHPLIFMVMSLVLVCALLYAWERREDIISRLKTSSTQILHKIDQHVSQIGKL